MKIRFHRDSTKFIRSIPLKHQKQIVNKCEELQSSPYPQDSKELHGFPYYRADVGEYRIIYYVEQGVLHIYLIGKRNDSDVYKKLKRKDKLEFSFSIENLFFQSFVGFLN